MEIIYASDVEVLSQCARRYWYDRFPPDGSVTSKIDPFEELLFSRGLAHEHRVLELLANSTGYEEATSVEHTTSLIQSQVPVIYQAQLKDETRGLFGKPDFLILGEDGFYRAADAKLSMSVDKEIGIQLAFYRDLLGQADEASVYKGNGEVENIGTAYDANYQSFLAESRSVLESGRPLVLYVHSKCRACSYNEICKPEFVEQDSLSLLYGVDNRSLNGLEKAGINTIADMASAEPADIPDIPYLKGDKKSRAVEQAKVWNTNDFVLLSPINLPEGTWVHFDIEDNPQTSDGKKHVYLWGLLLPPYTDKDYLPVWTNDKDEDQAGWLEFLSKLEELRTKWPDIKLIHYSSHEFFTIRSYAERYDMQADSTVSWLLDKKNGPLFDLKTSVDEHLILPLQGYGLKDVCKHPDLVNFQWEQEESGSQWSVVRFHDFLNENDPKVRDEIKTEVVTYNRDDVKATRALEEWLRNL